MNKGREKNISTETAVIVRKFDSTQKKIFVELFIKTFGEKPWQETWTEEKVLKHLNRILARKSHYAFSIFYGEKIVGFILGYIIPQYFFLNRTFYLDQFFIDSGFQNSGLGKKSMDALIRKLRYEKKDLILLLTKKESPARFFYQKQGFHGLSFFQETLMYRRI